MSHIFHSILIEFKKLVGKNSDKYNDVCPNQYKFFNLNTDKSPSLVNGINNAVNADSVEASEPVSQVSKKKTASSISTAARTKKHRCANKGKIGA